LALTGVQIGADEAIAYGLADYKVNSTDLAEFWESLVMHEIKDVAINNIAVKAINTPDISKIDTYFSLSTVFEMVQALETSNDLWAQQTAKTLRTRSPLMLHVVLEQIRRGRQLNLAQNLQMERGMIRHCFYTAHLGRFGNASETVEGIRALAVDKDHAPRWNPARLEDVTNDMIPPFFTSPWPEIAHPLRHLS
jgi:enoyl-CoA hydratase/carnithine racemase